MPVSLPAPACEPALCGNGAVDSCSECMPCCGGGPGGGGPPCGPPWGDADAGMCCTSATEHCDGGDLGGATCESLGYAGGTLGCGGSCAFDTTGCNGCAADPRVTSCGRALIDSDAPYALALAATDAEVGLAWITSSGVGADGVAPQNRLHFARFRADDLSLIAETGCFGPVDPTFVALTTTPTGWIVAADTYAGTEVITLDASGAVAGASRFHAGWHSPLMAARPGSGPLVVYDEPNWSGAPAESSTQAELLAADGSVEWTTRVFDLSSIEPQFGSAVFTGDGFLVAQRIDGVTVARIELDGRVSATSMPSHDATEYPQLGWTGTEARLVWADFGGAPTMFIARLDRSGARMGDAVEIGGAGPTYFNPCPTLGDGQDAIVLLARYTGGTGLGRQLDVARFDAAGRASVGPFAITQDPNGARSHRLARTGGRVVAAWISGGYGPPGFGGAPGADVPGRISLALVDP